MVWLFANPIRCARRAINSQGSIELTTHLRQAWTIKRAYVLNGWPNRTRRMTPPYCSAGSSVCGWGIRTLAARESQSLACSYIKTPTSKLWLLCSSPCNTLILHSKTKNHVLQPNPNLWKSVENHKNFENFKIFPTNANFRKNKMLPNRFFAHFIMIPSLILKNIFWLPDAHLQNQRGIRWRTVGSSARVVDPTVSADARFKCCTCRRCAANW